MENTKQSYFNIVGGVMFVILAVLNILFLRMHSFFSLIFPLFSFIAYITISITLFLRSKKLWPMLVGFIILSICQLVSCIINTINYLSYDRYVLFAIINLITNLLFVVGANIFAVIITALAINSDYKKKVAIKKLWFVPAALSAISVIIYIATIILDIFDFEIINYGAIFDISQLFSIFYVIGVLFAMMWLAYPNGFNKKADEIADENIKIAPPEPEGYCGLIKHVLLLMFTFGIWNLIWIYKTTEYLNRVEDEEPRNPVVQLLLCLIPLYNIYWIYKSAQRIDKLASENNIYSDLSLFCLISAIFARPISSVLMQEKINSIAKSTDDNETNTIATKKVVKKAQSTIDVTEELKKFKELLDTGIITQEEFDAKKKQLLDL